MSEWVIGSWHDNSSSGLVLAATELPCSVRFHCISCVLDCVWEGCFLWTSHFSQRHTCAFHWQKLGVSPEETFNLWRQALPEVHHQCKQEDERVMKKNYLRNLLLHWGALIKGFWGSQSNRSTEVISASLVERSCSASTVTFAFWTFAKRNLYSSPFQAEWSKSPRYVRLPEWCVWLGANEQKRGMKDGQRNWNVITTQLGPTLNFTTTEILWCVSEAAEHVSGPQASHYVEGQDTSLLYCLSIRAMATGRLESDGSLIIIHFNTLYGLIMNPCNPWQPPILPTTLLSKKKPKKHINSI